MFVHKYKKNQIRNECTELAKKLHVEFRNGSLGISIITEDGSRLFTLDELYYDKGKECKRYIKECADAGLQTYFK